MANTYTLIASNTLSASAASVTFSSIPSTYTDLVLKGSARGDNFGGVSDGIYLTLNSDTANNYSYVNLQNGDGTPGTVAIGTIGFVQIERGATGNTATANSFGSFEIYIPSYTATGSKQTGWIGAPESNTALPSGSSNAVFNASGASLYRGTSAISSILIKPRNSANWVSGSSFYLYGIKNL